MMLHETGVKGKRDRAVLINSYDVMVKEFKVPKDKRLTRAEIAVMSNNALYKASKDLYSQATIKQANDLAVKMGLKKKPVSWFERIIRMVKNAKTKQ